MPQPPDDATRVGPGDPTWERTTGGGAPDEEGTWRAPEGDSPPRDEATWRLPAEGSPRSPFAQEETDPADAPMTRAPETDASARPTPPEHRSGAFWDTVEASGEFQPGQVVFGRYVVQKKLGRGGMGAVWLVRHRELDTERALKLIVAGISYDGNARARFRREAQVMASFHHPNAVVVHDARLTENDVAYIEMEYVRGRPLSDEIRRGEPMPLDLIARLLDQLCDVLAMAHELGIVHRDLKPANMMLMADRPHGREHLKVLDFGIAKILGEPDRTAAGELQTQTGAFMGTPPYASPEQTDGRADTRSDLYAVGVILYELLTGHRPFSGPAARILVETNIAPPPKFAEINPAVDYPPEVEALVMRCLAKAPEDRPQTARALAEAFRAALPIGQGVALKAAPLPLVATRPRRVLPLVVAFAATLLLGAWVVSGLFPAPIVEKVEPKKKEKEGPPPVAAPTLTTSGSLVPSGFARAWKDDIDESGRLKAIRPIGRAAPLNLRLVVIPGGTFAMGEPGAEHEETLADFALGDTEVTNRQVRAYFQATGTRPPQAFEDEIAELSKGESPEEALDHPAIGLPLETIRGFASWIGGDLPTEAQWEYAARSRGQPGRRNVWPDPKPYKKDSGRANIDLFDELRMNSRKVRSYPDDRTEQGIFDMAGNVREWCRDVGRSPGEAVVRGGSSVSFADRYTNYAREFVSTSSPPPRDLGFRVAVVLQKPAPAVAESSPPRRSATKSPGARSRESAP